MSEHESPQPHPAGNELAILTTTEHDSGDSIKVRTNTEKIIDCYVDTDNRVRTVENNALVTEDHHTIID